MSEMIDCTEDTALLHNRFLSRRFCWNENGFFSDSLVNLKTGNEYCRGKGYEFAFSVNGEKIVSYSEPRLREVDGNMECRKDVPRFLGSEARRMDETTEELILRFSVEKYGVAVKFSCRISSEIPGIVKQLEIEALKDDLCITELIFDTFNFYPGQFNDCDYFCGSDDAPLPLNFAVEGSADVIRCHNSALKEGFLCGSAAPGPLRRFMGYIHWNSMDVSYSMGSVPFAKYLRKGEVFRADHSFLLLYTGNAASGDQEFRQLLRMVLPPAVKPGVMYCTWIPFLKRIQEKLILDLAEKAAGMGFRYFVLDDGWFTNEKRRIDREKFPHGLEFLSGKIRDMGLRFGLWYNIGTSYGDPDTPDSLACRLPDGSLKKSDGNKVLCFAGEHRQRVLEELIALAERYHVAYFKLDFSSILSPYAVQPYGCHSREHRYHHGYEDSVIEMYRGLLFLRNELKKRFPDLIVDFSFESFGTERPNIAALEYSDLHHVSNFSGKDRKLQNITKIRKQFYRWFGKLPPERILGGLLVLQNDSAAEYLLTSFTGAPLVSGDLRDLPEEAGKRVGKFTEAFHALADRECLTELEVVLDEDDLDVFIRRGESGHGFLCGFNRRKEDVVLDISTPFACRNVETGETGVRLPAESCGMFIF